MPPSEWPNSAENWLVMTWNSLHDVERQARLRRIAPLDHLVRHAVDE